MDSLGTTQASRRAQELCARRRLTLTIPRAANNDGVVGASSPAFAATSPALSLGNCSPRSASPSDVAMVGAGLQSLRCGSTAFSRIGASPSRGEEHDARVRRVRPMARAAPCPPRASRKRARGPPTSPASPASLVSSTGLHTSTGADDTGSMVPVLPVSGKPGATKRRRARAPPTADAVNTGAGEVNGANTTAGAAVLPRVELDAALRDQVFSIIGTQHRVMCRRIQSAVQGGANAGPQAGGACECVACRLLTAFAQSSRSAEVASAAEDVSMDGAGDRSLRGRLSPAVSDCGSLPADMPCSRARAASPPSPCGSAASTTPRGQVVDARVGPSPTLKPIERTGCGGGKRALRVPPHDTSLDATVGAGAGPSPTLKPIERTGCGGGKTTLNVPPHDASHGAGLAAQLASAMVTTRELIPLPAAVAAGTTAHVQPAETAAVGASAPQAPGASTATAAAVPVPPLSVVIFRGERSKTGDFPLGGAAAGAPQAPTDTPDSPLLPVASAVLDVYYLATLRPKATSPTEELRSRLQAPNVRFQVVMPARDGQEKVMDMANGLQREIKDALRAGHTSHTYTVGQGTYELDLHAWVLVNEDKRLLQPVRAVEVVDTGVDGAATTQTQRPIVQGSANHHVQVRYRGTWVSLPADQANAVLAGGTTALSAPCGTATMSEQFVSDTSNLLLFHNPTGQTYPYRVAAGSHPKSIVISFTPTVRVRALGDHWHWGPGTTTTEMLECMAAAPVPRSVSYGAGSAQHGVLPLRVFGQRADGYTLEPLPMELTRTIMDMPDLVSSRRAQRDDCGTFPFTSKKCPAKEMSFAATCGQNFLPSLPSETPAEPMGRVLNPSNKDDLRRIRAIIAYMGSTLEVNHVMQIVEIIDPARVASVRAVQQVRAKQLAAMKDAITATEEFLGNRAKRPLAHSFAMACASAKGAEQGNPLLLFHGTRALRPADVVCSGGPSMDHSADAAFYGRGIYASTSARYVQRAYAHRLDDRACLLSGVRQMLAVVGVAGNTYNARTRKRLSWDSVRAGVPSVPATSMSREMKLDVHSVSGYLDSSCDSRNFAFFYDTDVAPAYLITYRAREAAVATPPQPVVSTAPAPAASPFFLGVPNMLAPLPSRGMSQAAALFAASPNALP